MFNNSNGYSLADIAAATRNGGNNNGNGAWGDGAWWIIILFLFCFNGWGNGGWGGGRNGGADSPAFQGTVTRADLCSEFAFNNLDRAVTGINQGICDGFYAVNSSLMNGFNGVGNAICNLGNAMQGGFNTTQVALMQGQNALATQLADCCCTTQSNIKQVSYDNMAGQNAIQTQLASCCCNLGNQIERGFADTRYDMATNTCALKTQMANDTRDIIDSQNASTRAILDYLCQDKIATLQNENQALRLAASQAQQNSAIGAMISASEATILRRTGSECPQAAYIVQPPQPVSFPTNCCGQFNGFNNCGGC